MRVTAAPAAQHIHRALRAGAGSADPHGRAQAGLKALGTALIKSLKERGFAALTAPLGYTAPGPGTLAGECLCAGCAVQCEHSAGEADADRDRTTHILGRRHGTLRPRLIAAGRRMTKRAKRLKLRIVTRFAPTTGSAVSSVNERRSNAAAADQGGAQRERLDIECQR